MSKNSLDRKSVAFFRRVLGEDFPLLLFVFALKFVAIIHKGTHTGGKFFPAPLPSVTPVMLAPAIYALVLFDHNTPDDCDYRKAVCS